jgi:YebC/PmpR family DNA-binding regulatory protein
MAGHSKWANIKHRKAAQDSKKGKVFTKLIREITVAARLGGGVLADNPRLRAVVDKALQVNMSRDTVDRAIKRGVGGEDDAQVEEITYEGYGAAGVAVLVETMTDNRNRTVSEVRHAFTKCGGNLGTTGSVNYLFKRQGEIILPNNTNEDLLMEVALEVGAIDVVVHEDQSIEITTPWESVISIKEELVKKSFIVERAEVIMSPSTKANIQEVEIAEKVLKLIDMLEDLDDVQNVYTNVEISDAVMEQLYSK